MPAITIELSDEAYGQLSSLAAQQTASVEELALRTLEEKLREAEDAREMARRHYGQFQRLFDRLKE